jgi:carbonic anhydrase
MNNGLASSARDALELLFQGNTRFFKRPDSVNGNGHDFFKVKPAELVSGDQMPFCAILSCSDSHVAPELMFDQIVGDLFFIRTPGNHASMPALASIEYALLELKVPLIIVLGHSCCGAIQATLDRELTGVELPTQNLNLSVDALIPAVRNAVKSNQAEIEKEDLVNDAVRLHVEQTIDSLLESPVIKKVRERNEVGIIGAFYNLNSGDVEFSRWH